MPRDDELSIVTLNSEPATKIVSTLSDAKLNQLAKARAKSLDVRRRAQAAKLQAKLNHLRYVLGSDMRSDTVERMAKEMMNQEERLRAKQNMLTEKLAEAIAGFKDELHTVRKAVSKRGMDSGANRSSPKRAISDVSTSSSRHR